jgi:hypothetical protein
MEVETLTTLLGLRSTHSRMEDALQRFGVARRPELQTDPDDADGPVVNSQDWVSNLSVGIEFGFQEEGARMGLDQADRGIGPMILTEVYFYGERPGTRPYPLPLLFGLSMGDNRTVVRAKMAPLERTRRSYVRDTWEHPVFRITVSYAEHGDRIDFVVCMLRTEVPELFEGGAATLPSISTMISLLGKPIDDSDLRRIFVPLGLNRQTFSTSTERIIDFRNTYGFKLGFRKPTVANENSSNAPCLSEIECIRGGEFESRGWRGDLPFGIGFDDSPDTILAKVDRVPSSQVDQEFSGYAFWELNGYSLQVIYSTMENIVLRVCVSAGKV